LYRFEEYEHLACLILDAFDAGEDLKKISEHAGDYTGTLRAGELPLAEIYNCLLR
jgi:hypothetical protein